MSMLVGGSAAMTNGRRIHRYLTGKLRPAAAQQAAPAGVNADQARSHRWRCAFLIPARRLYRWTHRWTHRWAHRWACAHPVRLPLRAVPQ